MPPRRESDNVYVLDSGLSLIFKVSGKLAVDFTFYFVANITFLSKKSVLTFLMDRQNPCPQPLMTTALTL